MKIKKLLLIIMILSTGSLFSCKNFVQIEPPKESLVPATVFKSDALITAAQFGIYQQMALAGFACGNGTSISAICSLTADELTGYSSALRLLSDNQLGPDNSTTLWATLYQRIYNTNTMLEGLETAESLSPALRQQIKGEALFLRAFCYFYLVNLFGPVPIQLDTDYQKNSMAKRSAETEVYTQILKDLAAAEPLIAENYLSTERVRPNKDAVYALLSRVHLYLGDWANAEKYASLVISKTTVFQLVSLDEVFLKNSMETIWQLMPAANANSPASFMLLTTAAPTQASIRPDFVSQAFEAADLRKTAWTKSLVSAGVTYYYPTKYKTAQNSTTVKEYTMVLRLAEQYLIRAEARAMQDQLDGAIDDLDKIRKRTGLLLLKNTNPGIGKTELLNAIQKERRAELFAEWGDRWFELKRSGKLNEVLSVIKPNWNPDYIFFPIPRAEMGNNPNMVQNKGY